MKSYWTTAALLSLLLATGCADRGDKADGDEQPTAPAEAPADETAAREGQGEPAVSGREDAPSEGARATSGARAPRGTEAERREVERREEPREAPARRAAEWREVTIPAGTMLPLELETSLSTETAQVETPVRAKLRQAVQVNGITALPIGAVVVGDVSEVERAGRVKGRARLTFAFNRVQADDLNTSLRTNPLTYVGEATKGEDLTKIGVGAIGGAIVGGIAGGGEGAAKGAAIGGAAGTGVVLATRGKDVNLSSGTDLAASLASPLTIRVPIR